MMCAVMFLGSRETALRSCSSPPAAVAGSELCSMPRVAWKADRSGAIAIACWICASASVRLDLEAATGGEQGVGVGVIALNGEDGVGLLGGLAGIVTGDIDVAEVDTRLHIAGLEIDGALQLLKGLEDRALFKEDL